MTRTLHRYITREFLRVTLMSLVAFTLIVTVFAIIEPLRKRGLDISGALVLFAMTLPSVVSLTLPIATLFAATIVYGRFSQDNEFLAARASGVSTLTLMWPALIVGVLVTISSLVLNNWVTPVMAKAAQKPLAENFEAIAYGQLQRRGNIAIRDALVHVDAADPDRKVLTGVVILHEQGGREPTILAAATAEPHFNKQKDEHYLTALLHGPTIIQGLTAKVKDGQFAAPSMPLPTAIKEDVGWYNLQQLLDALRDPTSSAPIRQGMDRAGRRIVTEQLAEKLAATINTRGAYDNLEDREARYTLTLPGGGAAVEDGVVRLRPMPSADGKPAMIRVRRIPKAGGATPSTVLAPYGEVSSEWMAWSPKTMISASGDQRKVSGEGLYVVRLELYGDAANPVTAISDDSLGDPSHLGRWTRAEILMPPDILASIGKVDPNELRLHPDKYTNDPETRKAIADINSKTIPKWRARVLAEINMRSAYGLSCFGMIAMGAALGLLFRGGQIISAFALTMVPTALVICLGFAGKEMIRNPKASMTVGLSMMWGGPVLLMIGCIVIYAMMVRK